MKTTNDNSYRKNILTALCSVAVAGLGFGLGSHLFENDVIKPSGPVFMFSALRIAPIVGAVAVMAFSMGSRPMFWWGTFGALSGPMVIYTQSTGRYFHTAQINAEQWQVIGIFGAIICCTVTYVLQNSNKQNNYQFSIQFLVVVMAIAAILLTLWREIAG